MKKVMSIMLASLMLVSLLAVNVSAMVIPVEAEREVLSENFDGETHLFTTGTAGTLVDGATAADGYALQTRKAGTGAAINLSANYAIEFDFKVLASDRVLVCMNDADCSTVQSFGVALLTDSFATETWYTVKVVVDESLLKDNTDISGQKAIVVYYKIKGENVWNTANHRQGQYAADATNPSMQYRPHTANAKTTIGENSVGFGAYGLDNNFIVDNVKVYDLSDYTIADGTICYTANSITMPTYAGKDNLSQFKYTAEPAAPAEEGDVEYIITTFDAINTVLGMPLALHISGGYDGVSDAGTSKYVGTVSILSEEEIHNEWYTYKVITEQQYGLSDTRNTVVYRKPAGASDAEYESIKFLSGDGGRISSGIGSIRFGYRLSNADNAYGYSTEEGATNDFTSTKWEVANVQVLSGAAVVRGFAEANDGKLEAELAIVANNKNAAAFVAAYQGDRLVGVDFAELVDGEGNVELAADCVNADSAKLFIWENLSDTPIVEAIDLTTKL